MEPPVSIGQGWSSRALQKATVKRCHPFHSSLSDQFYVCIYLLVVSESESYATTDGQSASLTWNKAPIWGLRPDLYYCQTVAGLLMGDDFSDERTGSIVYNCYRSLPAQSFSGSSPMGLATIFYSLRFETSLFVASYGGGIRRRLHTG
jgi:hypothetical protein